MEQTKTEQVFCEGRNVEEALQAACDKLNTTPNQVEYEVVAEGSSGGMLGFLRGRSTKIRVWKKPAAQRQITELLKGFFERLDLDIDFEIDRGEDAYEVDIRSEVSDGLLIGRGGETLAALQHLVSRMVSHMDQDLRVRVDVAGYRKRRQDQLRHKAHDLAERVLTAGKEMATDLLPADERRIVHLALGDNPRVETHAVGEGLTKRVIVVPVGARSGNGGSRGGGRSRSRGAGDRAGRGRSDRPGGRGSEEGRSADAGRESGGGRSVEGSRGSEGGRSVEDGRGTEGGRPRRGRGPRRSREPEPLVAAEREDLREPRRESPSDTPPPSSPPSSPPNSSPSPAPETEESYFKIPESIGIVSSPSRSEEGTAGNSEDEPEKDQEVTFGRRRRPARRGRR